MITRRRDARRALLAPRTWCWTATVLVASCGGSITSADLPNPDVAEVVVAPLTATVIVGNTLPLQASVRDASGQALSGPTVVWSVRDTSVATVSATGMLTAHAVGSTEVAASANGKSGLASITVTPVPVASVSVAPARVDLAPGAHASLTAVAYDASGNTLSGRALVWASSNATVASVDESGAVTAVAAGAATITVSSEGITGSAVVNVAAPAIASVAIEPRGATIQQGATVQLTAIITDEGGAAVTNRIPTWTSSDGAIAIVSASGLVTARAPGSTSLSASVDDKADTVQVVVVTVPVGSVSVQPATKALVVGQSATLTATVKDATGAVVSDRDVAWRSSNAAVASVTQGGIVKALAAGAATISATSEGITGSAAVTVSAPVASIALQPASVTLQRNMTATLTPTLKDASGGVLTGRVITWTSSDSTIARVSGTGVVTALRLGAAAITATSEGKSASASVTVTTGPVDRIVITPASVDNLRDGHSVQLTGTALDANGDVISGADFDWHSSSTDVATVNSTGRVTGEHSGTTTITATFGGKTGSASVHVR